MDKDDISLILICAVILATQFYLGFFVGRQYEQKFWTKYYTDEMNQVCLECAGLK